MANLSCQRMIMFTGIDPDRINRPSTIVRKILAIDQEERDAGGSDGGG